MFCFLKARSTTRAMSLSSAGRIWSSISISPPSVPKRPEAEAISQPEGPAAGAATDVGGGDATAQGADAVEAVPLRLLGQRPGAPGVDDAAAELDPGDRQ